MKLLVLSGLKLNVLLRGVAQVDDGFQVFSGGMAIGGLEGGREGEGRGGR